MKGFLIALMFTVALPSISMAQQNGRIAYDDCGYWYYVDDPWTYVCLVYAFDRG